MTDRDTLELHQPAVDIWREDQDDPNEPYTLATKFGIPEKPSSTSGLVILTEDYLRWLLRAGAHHTEHGIIIATPGDDGVLATCIKADSTDVTSTTWCIHRLNYLSHNLFGPMIYVIGMRVIESMESSEICCPAGPFVNHHN